MLDDVRESFAAALVYLGYDINTTDEAQLEEAKQVLLTIKPYLAAFDSDSFDDLLVSGDTVIAHGWNGEFFKAMDENEDRNLGYIIPEEGGVIWTDAMAIPKTASHPYTAEVLINFLLDPEVGAMLTNYNFYGSPNDASMPYILDEIKEDPGIYPSDETLARMEFIADLGETTLEYDRIWTEVKSE
jgi:spermidine/putrescine transport system substrate-binding protein